MKIFALLLALAPAAGAASWTLDGYLKEVYSVSHELKQAEESLELSRSAYMYSLASFYFPSVTLSASNTPYSSAYSPRLSFDRDNAAAVSYLDKCLKELKIFEHRLKFLSATPNEAKKLIMEVL